METTNRLPAGWSEPELYVLKSALLGRLTRGLGWQDRHGEQATRGVVRAIAQIDGWLRR